MHIHDSAFSPIGHRGKEEVSSAGRNAFKDGLRARRGHSHTNRDFRDIRTVRPRPAVLGANLGAEVPRGFPRCGAISERKSAASRSLSLSLSLSLSVSRLLAGWIPCGFEEIFLRACITLATRNSFSRARIPSSSFLVLFGETPPRSFAASSEFDRGAEGSSRGPERLSIDGIMFNVGRLDEREILQRREPRVSLNKRVVKRTPRYSQLGVSADN